MKARTDDLRAVPSAWPALVALAVVGLLALGELVFDVFGGMQTHDRSNYLVENSVESLVLVGDLRYQAAKLESEHDAAQQSAILAQIDSDLRQYAPLATEQGEREEYAQLASTLDSVRKNGTSPEDLATIEASIDHLEHINRVGAYRNAEAIRATHARELAADLVVGAVTVLLAAIVGLVLVRALRRQRALLELHLQSLAERHKELEAFAGRVAHDLRGPLSPLRGYADVLGMEGSPEIQELASRIRRSTDRMGGIIDELLALSMHGKIARGQARPAAVARELLDEMAPELHDTDVTLAVGDHAVACTPGVIGQVMRNLISNAIKYRANDRRLQIRIEAERLGDHVVLAVADNGIGMDDDTLAHAFEPLYRAPGAARPGHGLGLSIVKRTIESAGGTVELTSKHGEGTRVAVKLPAA